MRRSLVAGNWKMCGDLVKAENLLRGLENYSGAAELAVFPPFIHLFLCMNFDTCFGAQNCAAFSDGAYTGEVSAAMLKNLGCHYVIIGHSERRQWFHEKNDVIYRKCEQAFLAGLVPILCVGETLAERESKATLSVVQEQLAVIRRLKDNCSVFAEFVVAYEPVWAIGTGKTASPNDAQAVHGFIRNELNKLDSLLAEKTRILYGGSVKPDNAEALFAMPDIDGGLVGGASLDVTSFLRIAECANKIF